MSPARASSSKRNLSIGFKPYTKGEPVSSLQSQDSKESSASPRAAGSSSPPTEYVPIERPGFPTYAQYKQVEANYLNSLTPRRQNKALISQAMFDRIWDVLHSPDSHGETAQFRYWARKMFTLSKSHRSSLDGFASHTKSPEEVLLHDDLLVAIQEQLYDLLCYCHGSTGHGGRDKTCALIRKHYTWVPKDLVSNFIKACPTCIMKKCGNINSAFATRMVERRFEDSAFSCVSELLPNFTPNHGRVASVSSAMFPISTSSHNESFSWRTLRVSGQDSISPANEEVDPIELAYREAVQRGRSLKASLPRGLVVPQAEIPKPVALTHEVPIGYKGTGWQYRHSDYASAHAELKALGLFQDGDTRERSKDSKAPNAMTLWGPEQFMQEFSAQGTNLPNVLPIHEAPQRQDLDSQGNISLGYMFLGDELPQLANVKDEPQTLDQHLDPMLWDFSTGLPSQIPSNTFRKEADEKANGNDKPTPVSMSIKRAVVPPRLDLDFPNDKAFTTYRNLREADVTPDTPLIVGLNWDQSFNLSPTKSDCSSSPALSQYSMFAMPPPMSTTSSTSSGSSALRTPLDEFPGGANGKVHIDSVKGKPVEPVEIELSEGIKEVCGL